MFCGRNTFAELFRAGKWLPKQGKSRGRLWPPAPGSLAWRAANMLAARAAPPVLGARRMRSRSSVSSSGENRFVINMLCKLTLLYSSTFFMFCELKTELFSWLYNLHT